MSDVAGADGGRRLRVDLDVDPTGDSGCPIVSEAESAAEVTVNAVGDECVADVTTPEGDVRRGTGEVDEDCLCHVFARLGYAPHFRRVEDGTILVTAYVDDRDAVRREECIERSHRIFERLTDARRNIYLYRDAVPTLHVKFRPFGWVQRHQWVDTFVNTPLY